MNCYVFMDCYVFTESTLYLVSLFVTSNGLMIIWEHHITITCEFIPIANLQSIMRTFHSC